MDYNHKVSDRFCYSSFHQKRSEPEPSCASMRSDDASMDRPKSFKSGETKTDLRYNIFIEKR